MLVVLSLLVDGPGPSKWGSSVALQVVACQVLRKRIAV
jgi:hypothetical protein